MTPSAPVVLAHGFTQTARSWDVFIGLLGRRGLSDDNKSAVDLPGHGTASDVRADLWESADRLVQAGGTGTYVGYSMGGRVGLHAALAHPRAVERLVLIGATAGIVDDTERAARKAADDALASHIEAVGVAAFLDEWLANPLFAGLTEATSQRTDRLRNTASGLASSLRLAGTGTQEPLWSQLSQINCPVLLLVGEHDPKFRAVAANLAALLPDATIVVIDGAGHSAHLERPEATADALVAWLDNATAEISN